MTRRVYAIALAVVGVLIAFAHGYGYHRDELYFVAAGHHLAWSYADQGPLTPLIARAMTDIAPGSLTVLRIPSAIAAGLIVVLTGLITAELRGNARAQFIAAATAGVASIVLATGHWLSTSTFDLLDWTAVTWLVIRAVRRGPDQLWLLVGVVLGVGLLNKPLPAFLAAALVVGVAISGPRRLLARREVWGGALLAGALWSPWLIWQADHGWPQLDVSRSIAAGNSTSSQPWWSVVPFQFLFVSPLLAPLSIAGFVALFRRPSLRDVRFVGWAWVVLAIVFMASGGKPYYLAGLFPVIVAAGAIEADGWLRAGWHSRRGALLMTALVLSAVVDATIALPVLPASSADPVVAVNPDVGETIGWPELVRTVANVDRTLGAPPGVVVLAANYGEAGAVDRYGAAYGLPHAYSGHNAYADWGQPPNGAAPVIVVGYDLATASEHMRGCRLAARISNTDGIDNDENGEPVLVCAGPQTSWTDEWPRLRHLG